ncbi:MAG: TIGR01459 family HAD-type hydrolase [Proteobacteria bacterium]|nr:TIGR01459 family HAD-type hydrolase [Pseudomonadota bacterium]
MNAWNDNAPIPLVAGLGALAGRYDALLVDLWGCLHNGVAAYADAVDALQRYRAGGGRVVLVSNAPRRNAAVMHQIEGFGLPADAWDAVMTAGEALRLEIEEASDPWYAALGERFHHIGTERDANLLEGLRFRRVAAPDQADFVLCCGIRAAGDTLEAFAGETAASLARALPMVSANPDRFVLRGPSRELCAGAIALDYAARGGAMRQEGKPYPAVYRRALAQLGGIPAERVLAIGDGIETDILGARNAGIDALWITGGLPAHFWGVAPEAPPPHDRVVAACAEHGVRPIGVLPLLRW